MKIIFPNAAKTLIMSKEPQIGKYYVGKKTTIYFHVGGLPMPFLIRPAYLTRTYLTWAVMQQHKQ